VDILVDGRAIFAIARRARVDCHEFEQEDL